MYLTISTSTNYQSRSVRLAQTATELLQELTEHAQLIDLADYELPIDNGSDCKNDDARNIAHQIGKAHGIILVVPIYHGDVSIAIRNLVQLCGASWQRKVVGFVSVAGEPISHSAILGFASSLMLEYRSFIIPDFAFVETKKLSKTSKNEQVNQSIRKLVGSLVRVTEALKHA